MAAPIADPAASGRVRRWVRRPGRPLVTFLARATAAAGGGVLLYTGFAPRTLWWLALPAFGLLGAAVHGRSARAGFGLGALFGLGFFLPLLRWTGIYVGPVPWLALSGAEAVFVGAAGAGAAVVSRLRPGPDGRPALGGRGVGRGRGAAGADALRRVPVGPGRVRPARRAVAAGGRRRRGAAAVVRDGAGRARARRGRAPPRPSRGAAPPRPRCWRSSRSRRARSPRCCRPRGRLPSAR